MPDPWDNYGADIKAKAAADELERLRAENACLRQLVHDALEDEAAFDVEWDKAARAALCNKER